MAKSAVQAQHPRASCSRRSSTWTASSSLRRTSAAGGKRSPGSLTRLSSQQSSTRQTSPESGGWTAPGRPWAPWGPQAASRAKEYAAKKQAMIDRLIEQAFPTVAEG
jgi:hypothetical protein